jgi:hypothetical protein
MDLTKTILKLILVTPMLIFITIWHLVEKGVKRG